MENKFKIKWVKFSNEGNISVRLFNNKSISIPRNYTKKLSQSSISDIKEYRISPDGYGIHFEKIDEDIIIKPLVSDIK